MIIYHINGQPKVNAFIAMSNLGLCHLKHVPNISAIDDPKQKMLHYKCEKSKFADILLQSSKILPDCCLGHMFRTTMFYQFQGPIKQELKSY